MTLQTEDIIASIGRYMQPLEKGGFEVESFSHRGDALISALAERLKRPHDIALHEFRNCISKAVHSTLRAESIDLNHFETELRTEFNRIRTRKGQSYIAWSKLSYITNKNFKIKMPDGEFEIRSQLPKCLRNFEDPARKYYGHFEEPKGSFILCSGYFRSQLSAGYSLTKLLEQAIAWLNFPLNIGSGYSYPLHGRAKFKMGPVILIYNQDRTVYEEIFWQNDEYNPFLYSGIFAGHDDFEYSRNYLRAMSRKRRINSLLTTVTTCLIILNRSWLSGDPKESMALAWTAFERLFSQPYDRTSQEIITRRAVKFDADPVGLQTVLESLQKVRNSVYHSLPNHSDMNVLYSVYEDGLRFLLWKLNWCVQNGSKFESKEEYLSFTDYPKDEPAIEKEKRLMDLQRSYWSASWPSAKK